MVSCFFAATAFWQTYCTPTYTNLCSSSDFINNFVFNSLTNLNTGCNGNANNFIYYNSTPTTTVQQGNTYGIAMQAGNLYSQGFGVWIDYNQDSDFADTGEFVYASPTADTSLFSGNVAISPTASTGVTRLRVRCKYAATVLSTESCSSMSYGETEDYNITITAAAPCTNPPTAGNALSSVDSACAGVSFTLALTGNSTGSGQTYQWQSSPDNSSWSNISGATGITYSTSQTTATYYRCMVTCGTAVASTSYNVKMKPLDQCYCTAVHSVACTTTDNIDTVLIVGTTLNNPATGCTSGTAQAYTVYPASGNTTATLTQGTAYTLSVTSTDNSIISVWIDYNQDGIFAASEWQQVTTSSTANVAATTSITIPFSSLTGLIRMRVRSRVAGVANGATDACTSFGSGETEDYIITIVAGSACTNPPTAGTTVSSANPVCPGVSFTLSLSGGTSGTGQTYQWQSSTDGVSYANISGATSSTYNAIQNDTAYYRCIVTCGASSNSTVLQVNMNAYLQCYCDTILHGAACGATDNINAVQIISTTLINSNTGCTSGNGQAYTVYPATGNTTATLQQGVTYTFSVTSKANSIISVWIDYNQNGLFEAPEWTQVATTTIVDTPATAGITIPMSALTGQTGMRVRSRASGSPNAAIDACTEFFSGETEDYIITISAGAACTNPPTAGTANSSDSLICATDSFTLSLTGNSTGTGQTYQWQSSPDNSTWTNIGGATTLIYFASQTAANYYRCMVTCGASVPSTSVFVNNQQCFCTPTYSSLCTSNDFIDDFSFNTLSKQNSGCNGNPDNYILDTTVTTTVIIGGTYNLSMQSGAAWAQGFGVWIDYNKNGDFNDSGEFVYASPTVGTTVFSGTVTIPSGTLPGITRLRVRCSYNDTILASESCSNFSFGETEDYNITISNPFPCTNPPTAGMAVANPNSVCSGGSFFLSLSGNSTGTGQTYQWQSSADNINFNNINGATGDTLTASASAATYYRCIVTCGTSANSASVQVTMVTLSAGTASGPLTAIGNQVKTYSLSGSNGNIQWQSSADGITFADITGASANPQNLIMPGSAVNDTVYVRAKVSGPGCTDVFSNVVMTIIDCATPYSNGSASGDFINNVQFGTINNSSTIDSLGGNVQDFKGAPGGTTNVCKGMNYSMTVSTDTTWTQGKAAWIDFNNNGSYADAGELIFGPTPSSKGAVTDTVLIPLTAVSDTVKMRVICVYADTPDVNACFIGPYGFGEIEEYSVIINPTPDATITASGPLTFCQGSSLTLTTGTGSSYTWSTGATTQSISVNAAGNYSVTVSNTCNCSSSDTVTVTVNPSPSATATATSAACGANNGSVSVSATGGTSPYSYLWNTGATTATINGQPAGTYFVTVTDVSGCPAISSASVNNVGGPSVAVSSSNVNCNGGNTGSATATASGGTTPYTYNWSNGQTTANATALVAGTYTVTVTDMNNCIASSAISITQPAQLLAAPSTTNVSCNGGNNGTANANAMGGTSPYTYLWSNSQISASITGLAAGTYSVTVTDNKSCTANASIIITQPAAFSVSVSSTNISCNGGNNGSSTATAGGGTGPYSYLWSGGQTTPSVNNLSAGAFSVTVTDNNGCTSSASGNITQPAAITLTVSSTNAACGISNGSATVSAGGGTGSISFLWSNGQTNSTATGLASGTYSVTVTDANNCSNSASTAVGSAGAPSVAVTTTDVSCSGSNNGTATASVTGGTSPYTYLWSGGQTTATATGLAAGAYTVTVTGNDGCSASSSDTVNAAAAIVSSATSTNVSCNGGNNGTATVTTSGGNTPYSYLWSGGQTTATATGLQAGIYAITVTDNNGCTDSASSVTISQPPAIVVTTTATTASCGSSNGSATATATGGAGGFTFTWSNGQTGATATAIAAGTYSVSATDSSGCFNAATVAVNNSGAPLVTVAVNNVFCNGGNNGSATANATGGVTPYSYNWSNGQTTASANGLTAGNYSVTVSDNNNCVTIKSTTITEPTALVLTTSSTNAACGSSNGSATATVSGGVTPYQYSWAGGQTTANITGLSAGTYNVTVADANGCLQSSSANISNAGAPSITVTSVNVNCAGGNNGNATVTATGGATPYSYLWSNGQTTATASGLIEGTYSVTVSDAVNCKSIGSATISAANPAPAVDLGADTASCGSISLNAGSGFSSYLWNNGSTAQTISASISGVYFVTVTNANGCSNSDSVNVIVNNAMPVDLGADTLICLETDSSYVINAGSGFSAYLWSDSTTGQTLTVNTGGIYSVTVTDSNGCTDNDSVTVSFQVCLGLNEITGDFSVSVFPNPNKGIFTVETHNNASLPVKIEIFNVLGEKIYRSIISGQKSSVIDLKNYGSGIYFMQLKMGEKIVMRRIVVE